MPDVEIPEWHQTSYDPAEVINLRSIAGLTGAPGYAALRSYATGRREHALYGPMPAPVARIANRRLWLMADVQEWLTVPIPAWQRSKQKVADWIEQGRPRRATADAEPAPIDAATMPDDGRLPPAP